MNTSTNHRRVRNPFLVISAAAGLSMLAFAIPASASKSVPEKPVPGNVSEAMKPMRCETRFCGHHHHHHGHHYTVCFGDHDHEYYCPGHH